MAKINIDGKSYTVDAGKNLLEVVLSLGLNLPYFCWHPAMGSVGACRQCAVKSFKDEDDKQGKIIMACMEAVQDGMRISIDDPEAREMRSNVIEWLMTNHPHDCPICDEGGECHLQDMTQMSGHVYRRFRFNKRTYRNQYLGPFINHEMNRCIQCYRCVRFYRDYAGGDDLQELASKNRVYFGRHEEGVLQSEFSGNLVEICPTGVFTDKTLKQHYTRKWDLQTAPSVCHLCSLGCNIIAGERYGKVRRILSRYNGDVNGYFICDRGRFGYEFVNSVKRIRHPLQKLEKQQEKISEDEILSQISQLVRDKKTIGIGSAKSSLESNYLMKKLVGKENFYLGMNKTEHSLVKLSLDILKNTPARIPSLKETEKADVVLILGEDVTNSAPMLDLSLHQAVRNRPMNILENMKIQEWHDAAVREAIQNEKGPLFIATPAPCKLDKIAAKSYRAAPQDIARLGYAIGHLLDDKIPDPQNLSSELKKTAEQIAEELKNAKRPLIISGTSSQNENLLQSAANIAGALCDDDRKADLFLVLPEANSLGLVMLDGPSLEEAFTKNDTEAAIILEQDLFEKFSADSLNKFLKTLQSAVSINFMANGTTAQADWILPAGAFTEGNGTLVNNEGRAQRFYEVYEPDGEVKESWKWLLNIMKSSGSKAAENLNHFDDITQALVEDYSDFKGIEEKFPSHEFRIFGEKIPRESHRYSGRTAMHANKNVSEPKPPQDPETPLSYTMEGYQGQPPSALIPRFWAPAWNSVQSINKFQIEVGGPLHGGNPGVRLLSGENKAKMQYFREIPEKFKAKDHQWLAVPVYHIFGSEKLSLQTNGISELAPSPYLLLNTDDAKNLKIEEQNKLVFNADSGEIALTAKLSDQLPSGLVGYPVGLPGMPFPDFPLWGKITGAKNE